MWVRAPRMTRSKVRMRQPTGSQKRNEGLLGRKRAGLAATARSRPAQPPRLLLSRALHGPPFRTHQILTCFSLGAGRPRLHLKRRPWPRRTRTLHCRMRRRSSGRQQPRLWRIVRLSSERLPLPRHQSTWPVFSAPLEGMLRVLLQPDRCEQRQALAACLWGSMLFLGLAAPPPWCLWRYRHRPRVQ